MSYKHLQIELQGFDEFIRGFWENKAPGYRLGQAFFNHYNLQVLSNKEAFSKLYELDGDEALREIQRLVDFN